MLKSRDQWHEILLRCGVAEHLASRWAGVFADAIGDDTFSQDEAELDDFLGQILHESAMLTRVEENLNYRSGARIRAVWPSRFPTAEAAQPFAHNPRALANKVYGGRMGNGPEEGWTYRGRGLLQVTGRDNYAAVGKALGIDLVGDPDRLAEPDTALRASIAWWERNIPDAVMGDIKRVTQRVNGGTNGLEHRADLTDKAEDALS